MLFREISRVLGRYLLYFTLILCIPLSVAIGYDYFFEPLEQTRSTCSFLGTIGISLLFALIFIHFGKRASGMLHRRESILLVAIIWFLTAALGALPFLFSHTLQSPVDAYFESTSALTTTGSTILYPKVYDSFTGKEKALTIQSPENPNMSYTFYGTVTPIREGTTRHVLREGVEAVGKGLLFWRSFMQWLGGMGVVVLFIAILPALAMGGRFLFEAEMPGPSKEGMTPRIKQTASMLWKIYLGLTVAQTTLLLFTNRSLSLFDAVTLSFSTLSTGGFSIHNAGLEAYHNSWTNGIVMLFMVIGSLNFVLYFHLIKGKIYRIYQPEFFIYLATVALGCLFMACLIWKTPVPGSTDVFSLKQAVYHGSFQAISAQTSTGFAISDYVQWPYASQMLTIILMFIGGMSGSTSGGIKMARHAILVRFIYHKIKSVFRPDAVNCLKIGSKEISDQTSMTVLTFFCILIACSVLGIFLLVLDGVDPLTSLGVIGGTINNAGLTFGVAGPTESCAFLSPFSKIVAILLMVLGRLEFFALLVLLVPAFWKTR